MEHSGSVAVGVAKNTKMTARVSLLHTVNHKRRYLRMILTLAEKSTGCI